MSIQPFDTRDNFTKFHNYTLDHIMPSLPPNAWKVLCFIIRKTKGWGKEIEQLSYSLIRQGTGIKSDETMRAALKELIDREYVIVGRGGQFDANTYSLNTAYKAPTTEIVEDDCTTEIEATTTTKTVAVSTTKIVDNKRKSFKETKEEKEIASDKQTPPPSSSSEKKGRSKKERHENAAPIFHAYVQVATEYEGTHKILYPATWETADELARMGYVASQVVSAYKKMKQDRYWQGKNLTLISVAEQIGVLLKDNNYADTTKRDPKWEQTFTGIDLAADIDYSDINF